MAKRKTPDFPTFPDDGEPLQVTTYRKQSAEPAVEGGGLEYAKLLTKAGGRKFVLGLVSIGVLSVLAWYGKAEPELIVASAGLYKVANAFAKGRGAK